MTGYGYREYQDENLRLVLELKAYNNRYLDLSVTLPSPLSQLEIAVRDFLKPRLVRGRIELTVRLKELEEQVEVRVDRPAARQYLKALRELSETAGIEEPVTLSHLLAMEGVMKMIRDRDYDRLESLILQNLEEVVRQYEESRRKEGEYTAEDIRRNIAVIQKAVDFIDSKAETLECIFEKNLRERFEIMVGDRIDEGRIAAEIAVLLMKYGIGEELSRLKSHIETFLQDMESTEPAGKKLDFICQELGREINTIGSKSTLIEINRSVIEMKDALEKIREQLRNVE